MLQNLRDNAPLIAAVVKFLGDSHGNMLASVQDSRGNLRRLQTLQNNMERVLAEKLKELDTMNIQVKVSNLLL